MDKHLCAVDSLHGGMPQEERTVVYQNFKNGKIQVLVATCVAARGLDFPDVDMIVHFNPPEDKETYLHASGRTGRAGRQGTSVALYRKG